MFSQMLQCTHLKFYMTQIHVSIVQATFSVNQQLSQFSSSVHVFIGLNLQIITPSNTISPSSISAAQSNITRDGSHTASYPQQNLPLIFQNNSSAMLSCIVTHPCQSNFISAINRSFGYVVSHQPSFRSTKQASCSLRFSFQPHGLSYDYTIPRNYYVSIILF